MSTLDFIPCPHPATSGHSCVYPDGHPGGHRDLLAALERGVDGAIMLTPAIIAALDRPGEIRVDADETSREVHLHLPGTHLVWPVGAAAPAEVAQRLGVALLTVHDLLTNHERRLPMARHHYEH